MIHILQSAKTTQCKAETQFIFLAFHLWGQPNLIIFKDAGIIEYQKALTRCCADGLNHVGSIKLSVWCYTYQSFKEVLHQQLLAEVMQHTALTDIRKGLRIKQKCFENLLQGCVHCQ